MHHTVLLYVSFACPYYANNFWDSEERTIIIGRFHRSLLSECLISNIDPHYCEHWELLLSGNGIYSNYSQQKKYKHIIFSIFSNLTFKFLEKLCVCVCYMHELHIMCMHIEGRGLQQVLFPITLHLIFKTESLTEPDNHHLARLVGQQIPRICSVPYHPVLGLQSQTTPHSYLHRFWRFERTSSCLLTST